MEVIIAISFFLGFYNPCHPNTCQEICVSIGRQRRCVCSTLGSKNYTDCQKGMSVLLGKILLFIPPNGLKARVEKLLSQKNYVCRRSLLWACLYCQWRYYMIDLHKEDTEIYYFLVLSNIFTLMHLLSFQVYNPINLYFLVVHNRTCNDSSCSFNGKCAVSNGLLTCRYVIIL